MIRKDVRDRVENTMVTVYKHLPRFFYYYHTAEMIKGTTGNELYLYMPNTYSDATSTCTD